MRTNQRLFRSVITLSFALLALGLTSTGFAQNTVKQPDFTRIKKLKKFKLSSFEPQVGHSRQLSNLAFSVKGDLLVTASGLDDGLVKVWDVVTGRVLHTLDGEDYASFSADGKLVATGNVGGPVDVWDVKTGKKIKSLKGSGPIVFSPDGAYLVGESADTESGGGTLLMWSTKDWSQVATLEGHKASITSLTVSKDGRFIATGSYDESVKVWDLKTKKLIRTFNNGTNVPTCVSLSPDAETLAVTYRTKNNAIDVWDVSASKKIKSMTGHTKSVLSLAWTADGKTILSASLDDTTNAWDMDSGKITKSYKGGGLVTASYDGRWIAHGRQAIEILDAKTGKVSKTLPKNQTLMFDAFFSADGKVLMTTDSKNSLDRWDVKTGKFLKQTSFKNGTPEQADGELIFSSGGKFAAIRAFEGTKVTVFDGATGKQVKVLELEDIKSIRNLTFSPNEEELVVECESASQDEKTRLIWWSLTANKAIASTSIGGFVRVHGFADDGKNVAIITHGRSTKASRLGVKVWRRETGLLKSIGVKDIPPYAGDVRFAHKDQTIAFGDGDNTVKLFDRTKKSFVNTFSGHTQLVNIIQFSKNDKWLATGSWDESVKVWDVTKKAPILSIDDVHYKAQSLTFSPTNTQLAITHKGWVRLIDVSTGHWRNLYKSGDNGWMGHDSNGKFDCGGDGCSLAMYRNQAGLFITILDRFVAKYLKGLSTF